MLKREAASAIFVLFLLAPRLSGCGATVFTLVNKCRETVWPGILPNIPNQEAGFVLQSGKSQKMKTSAWSGRIWGRSGCNFDSSGAGSCETGDCGKVLNCNGAGGEPPVSLAEFTLDGSSNHDFYDVSLVDGYNLPLDITPSTTTDSAASNSSSSTNCRRVGCDSDLRDSCPSELAVRAGGHVVACKSACDAFNTSEYCCTGQHANPNTCQPSQYSVVFKKACPTAYSYAYDDRTSTFTCPSSSTDYTITFCPGASSASSSSPSSASASASASASISIAAYPHSRKKENTGLHLYHCISPQHEEGNDRLISPGLRIFMDYREYSGRERT